MYIYVQLMVAAPYDFGLFSKLILNGTIHVTLCILQSSSVWHKIKKRDTFITQQEIIIFSKQKDNNTFACGFDCPTKPLLGFTRETRISAIWKTFRIFYIFHVLIFRDLILFKGFQQLRTARESRIVLIS